MSTITTLRQEEDERSEARVVLSGTLTQNLLSALSDESSRRILVSAVAAGKTVQEISLEQAVPLSTCYRRVRGLIDEGLLVVERIVVTGEGKKYIVYRSSFRTVQMVSNIGGTSATAELNEGVAEKFHHWRFHSLYPSERQNEREILV